MKDGNYKIKRVKVNHSSEGSERKSQVKTSLTSYSGPHAAACLQNKILTLWFKHVEYTFLDYETMLCQQISH